MSEDFTARLRAARARKGLVQADLARDLEVSLSSVGNWESGQNKPSASMLGKIAARLDVTIAHLLEGTPLTENSSARWDTTSPRPPDVYRPPDAYVHFKGSDWEMRVPVLADAKMNERAMQNAERLLATKARLSSTATEEGPAATVISRSDTAKRANSAKDQDFSPEEMGHHVDLGVQELAREEAAQAGKRPDPSGQPKGTSASPTESKSEPASGSGRPSTPAASPVKPVPVGRGNQVSASIGVNRKASLKVSSE